MKMRMNKNHPNFKLKPMPLKISDDDILMLKDMKKEGKTIHDARYWLIKRYWDNDTQKLLVDPRTVETWLKKYFV